MSNEAPNQDMGCARFSDDLAELSVGVLTGRDRARALAHVDECSRCAEELEQLSRVADTMLQMAPEADPPVGFESRLFERMGVEDRAASGRRRLRSLPSLGPLRPSQWAPAAVAAAAVLATLGVGLSGTLAPAAPQANSAHGANAALSANFVENGKAVGHVVAVGGSRPWISMMLEDSKARGTVTCVIVTRDGVTHQVGTFVARQGYGAWVAPLHIDLADMRAAEVVSPGGTVIATATLS